MLRMISGRGGECIEMISTVMQDLDSLPEIFLNRASFGTTSMLWQGSLDTLLFFSPRKTDRHYVEINPPPEKNFSTFGGKPLPR